MKNFQLFSLIALLSLLTACWGDGSKNGEDSFEKLGNDAEFKEKHDEPRDNSKAKPNGEIIEIAVNGQENATAYAMLNDKNNKYVLVFHEWWGLNNYIKSEVDRLHEALDQTNIIALDLYDGKVAKVRDSAQKYMQSADPERIMSIIEGTLRMLPENSEIATIGWCFGGGWSLKAAIAAENRAEACIIYYGMPINDRQKLEELSADVLFIYGKQDKWINDEVASQFAENMRGLDQELILKGFDADHAFANPTQESFNEGAAEEANAIALEFLRSKLLSEDNSELKKES